MRHPIVTILSAALLTCSTNDYEFGDITRAYCSAPNESRQLLRQLAEDAGLSVPDYCATFGIVVVLAGDSFQVIGRD